MSGYLRDFFFLPSLLMQSAAPGRFGRSLLTHAGHASYVPITGLGVLGALDGRLGFLRTAAFLFLLMCLDSGTPFLGERPPGTLSCDGVIRVVNPGIPWCVPSSFEQKKLRHWDRSHIRSSHCNAHRQYGWDTPDRFGRYTCKMDSTTRVRRARPWRRQIGRYGFEQARFVYAVPAINPRQ